MPRRPWSSWASAYTGASYVESMVIVRPAIPEWSIPSVLESNLVLKANELFLVGDIATDGSGERATGLYLRDTRFLSVASLTLDGQSIKPITSRMLGPNQAAIIATNPRLHREHNPLQPQSIGIEQLLSITEVMDVQITLTNYSPEPLDLTFGLRLGTDFRDLFDIRGFPRVERGTFLRPELHDMGFTVSYRGLDEAVVGLDVSFDRAPTGLQVVEPQSAGRQPDSGSGKALAGIATTEVGTAFAATIASGETWRLRVILTPRPATGGAVSGRDDTPITTHSFVTQITVDAPAVQALLDRAMSDLELLQTSFADGTLPAAGIPWYIAPFGRDSLITSLQTFALAPGRAVATLETLAKTQGTRVDPDREEEPGKVLHEIRYGEMARCHEIPHTPYYGTADATPLFAMLCARVLLAGIPSRIDLRSHLDRALEWIETFGDRDGDGLVEYVASPPDGSRIVHQGWKDSHDSLHRIDGTPVSGSIALVEIQGYVYAAYAAAAELAERDGDGQRAAALRTRADRVRDTVNELFWLEDEGCHAQALDGDKRPVAAISSNAGHLLWCGVPTDRQAERMVDRLTRPDMWTGWGLRTLSRDSRTYNPMSYHNGSIWPHDNSLVAAGMIRYGYVAEATQLLANLLDVASTQPLGRLPELYCGFEREGHAEVAPIPYPVSCSPQAWSAAALPFIVSTLLGVDRGPDGLTVDGRHLPTGIDRATVRASGVDGAEVVTTIQRGANGLVGILGGPRDGAS